MISVLGSLSGDMDLQFFAPPDVSAEVYVAGFRDHSRKMTCEWGIVDYDGAS